MKPHRVALLPSFLVLLCAFSALRWLVSPPQTRQQSLLSWQEPGGGPQTFVPDLATSGALPLSWLPGVGSGRAEAILRHRAALDVPLLPERLALLPEIGSVTAARVHRWYQVHAP